MSRCNALKEGNHSERTGWPLYRRVSDLLFSPTEWWYAEWSWNCMSRCNALKNGHLPERKSWALYRRVSVLLLSPKEGWSRIKCNLHVKVQSPEKLASSWEEGLNTLPEGEWAVSESQRRIKWKLHAYVQCPEKRASSWENGLSLHCYFLFHDHNQSYRQNKGDATESRSLLLVLTKF